MHRLTSVVLMTAIVASAGIAEGNDVAKQFFADIENERADLIVSRMTPDVAAEVDVPMMQLLASTIRTRLGPVQRITTTGLTYKLTPKGRLSEKSASVVFEKGKAECRFATLNGKLAMFDVQSDQLVDWLKVPSSTGLYERLAKRGLREILMGDPKSARAMWHDALKSTVSLERLREIKDVIHSNLGEVSVVDVVSVSDEKGDIPTLRVHFEIEAENASTTGHVRIQFAGMKGHILGFNVSLPKSQ